MLLFIHLSKQVAVLQYSKASIYMHPAALRDGGRRCPMGKGNSAVT